ncbi:MAG TPA: RNA polymerase sigma factor [Candidatus Eisenbacteria bacterium]|nr:RNA polymerase sigma factor [Candidatus Eisenbacteria bacterium]
MCSTRSREPDDCGPEREFTRLYEEHRSALYAFLLGRAGEPETARDLLQETFLRAWRHAGAWRDLPAERRRAWLFAVARNLVIDVRRSQAVRSAAQVALRRTAAESAPASDEPPARAELAERVELLEAEIRCLPEPLRVALAMCTVGGLTSAQAGELLGEPAGTIRYRVNQARRRLAAALQEAGA